MPVNQIVIMSLCLTCTSLLLLFLSLKNREAFWASSTSAAEKYVVYYKIIFLISIICTLININGVVVILNSSSEPNLETIDLLNAIMANLCGGAILGVILAAIYKDHFCIAFLCGVIIFGLILHVWNLGWRGDYYFLDNIEPSKFNFILVCSGVSFAINFYLSKREISLSNKDSHS